MCGGGGGGGGGVPESEPRSVGPVQSTREAFVIAIRKHEALHHLTAHICEPVWPSGKAEGPRFECASALLSLQKLWSVDTVL